MKSSKSRQPKRMAGLTAALLGRQRAEQPLPFVSVVTPTCQRRSFLPYLLHMYLYQDYPAQLRELVILDDSPTSNQDLVEQLTRGLDPAHTIRYYHQPEKRPIGKKRNEINDLATGEIIICMDDDDYYPPERISYTVREMQLHNADFAGCDQIPVWYSHLDRIYMTAKIGDHHALNGTFAYRRSLLKRRRYDDQAELAEEGSFLNGFTTPVLQLDPWKSIICVSHSANTYDKDFIMGSCQPTRQQLGDMVTDKNLLRHFQRLHRAPMRCKVNWDFFTHIVLVGTDEQISAACLQQLSEMGIAANRVHYYPRRAGETLAQQHLALAKLAKKEAWPNYLLLDTRLAFVQQEKVVSKLNKLLQALPHIDWAVLMLGAQLQRMQPLRSMPGVVRAIEAKQAVAYAVTGSYYHTLIENISAGIELAAQEPHHPDYALDQHWQPLMLEDHWLSLYPSMAYLSQDQQGNDITAYFFQKIST